MKITIKGRAGQGVQLIAHVAAKIMAKKGWHVAFTNDYTPLMRTGDSNAYLVISKEEIDNPVIDKADKEYDLTQETDKQANMVALGKMLKELGVKYDEKELEEELPEKYLKENLEAIKKAYAPKA